MKNKTVGATSSRPHFEESAKRKNKGITLIALIITIIVMLILVMVSISIAINTGLFDAAGKATQKTNIAKEEEKEIASGKITIDEKPYNSIDEYVSEINKEKVEMINFTVAGVEYTVEKGTTWEAWLLQYVTPEELAGNTQYPWGVPFFDGVSLSGSTYISYEIDAQSGNFGVKPEDEINAGDYYKGRQAECVFPNTEILVSLEGETVLAKDLEEGNDIVYYNFETETEEVGKVYKAFVHKNAAEFVRYEFEDGTYIEVTDYHPIYTKEGWKSLTRRNGYEIPEAGDEVKTPTGWKKLNKIETWEGIEDCYNFIVITEEGERVYNYYGNGTLVEGPTKLKDVEF